MRARGATHADRGLAQQGRHDLGRLLVGRHLQSAEVIEQITYLLFIKRLDEMHIAEEAKARTLKRRWNAASSRGQRPERGRALRGSALVPLRQHGAGEMFDDRRRARLSLPRDAGRRRLDLCPPHEGRPLHHPDPACSPRSSTSSASRHGRPRHQGRSLRIHARQDRHRRPERPVPHATAHHPADGRADGADAAGHDLRSRLRHCGLPGRRGRVSARAHPEAASRREAARALPRETCSTASTSTPPCCASAA